MSDAKTGLMRLADALVEDIFNAPDEEILADFRAAGRDPKAYATEMRARFAKTQADQAELKRAREIVSGVVIPPEPKETLQ